MIAGLDSSADRPTPATIEAARAAGVRLWIGYIATRPNVGLFSAWDLDSFNVARQLGSTPVAMASGYDDPAALRDLATAWNVRLCLDCEGGGLRDLGPWTQGWLDIAGAGIYGNAPVHGVRAAFHILASYPGTDPGESWPSWLARAAGPLGWQWQGTHSEFGLSVDRGWYDDWFASGSQEQPMTDAEQVASLTAHVITAYVAFVHHYPSPEEIAAWVGQARPYDPAGMIQRIMSNLDSSGTPYVPTTEPQVKADIAAAIGQPTAGGAVPAHVHDLPGRTGPALLPQDA